MSGVTSLSAWESAMYSLSVLGSAILVHELFDALLSVWPEDDAGVIVVFYVKQLSNHSLDGLFVAVLLVNAEPGILVYHEDHL